MRIKTLSIHNFRNFRLAQEVEFPDAPLLVAAAPNATGKTNFLEAIAVLLRGKSFRAGNEECVQWGQDYFLLRGLIDRADEQDTLAVQYHAPSRKLRIEENNLPVSPVTFYSHYPFILFLPEDTFLFHRGPAMRRNFINTALVSSPHYLSAVVQYHRALGQRNGALKQAKDTSDVEAWTALVVEHARSVWTQREAFMQYLSSRTSETYADLFEENFAFEIEYVRGAADPDNFAALLAESWEHERRYGYTLYGPHRDDIRIRVGGRPAAAALSRGQMRSLVIALKIVSLGFMRQLLGEEPLLLFDEVLSELDERRQKRLLERLPDTQILLTCTQLPEGVSRQKGVHLLDLQSIANHDEEEVQEEKTAVAVQ